MKVTKFILLITITKIMHCSIFQFPQKMVISVPVADLRAQPQANAKTIQLPTTNEMNPLQISQLLLGEYIFAIDSYTDDQGVTWLKVHAIQQEKYSVQLRWHGYPGWIQAKQTIIVENYPAYNLVVKNYKAQIYDQNQKTLLEVSIGTRLQGKIFENNIWQIILPDNSIGYINNSDIYVINSTISESEETLRCSIIETAKKFLENLYSWGGRSYQNNHVQISSVDCSGLIGLSYLAHGLQIPRMSREQFLASIELDNGADLQPGDVIFFAPTNKNPLKIDHIMMYIGNGNIIESTYADDHIVRIISFKQRIGKSYTNMKSGDIFIYEGDHYFIYFGSYFKDWIVIQNLRDNALKCEN